MKAEFHYFTTIHFASLYLTVFSVFLGDSIADVKFNPDDFFLGGEDQDLELEVSVLNLQKFSIALDLNAEHSRRCVDVA